MAVKSWWLARDLRRSKKHHLVDPWFSNDFSPFIQIYYDIFQLIPCFHCLCNRIQTWWRYYGRILRPGVFQTACGNCQGKYIAWLRRLGKSRGSNQFTRTNLIYQSPHVLQRILGINRGEQCITSCGDVWCGYFGWGEAVECWTTLSGYVNKLDRIGQFLVSL